MSDRFQVPEGAGTPPSINPYLQTLDRMQQRETLRPDHLRERAGALLRRRYGPSDRREEAAFAHAAVGLLAGHTNYCDGFAMLMPLVNGTAVAVREAAAPPSRLTFEGGGEAWAFGGEVHDGLDRPAWVCVVEALVGRLAPAGHPVEVAVVSTIQPGCVDTYLAALGVACARAVQALFGLTDDAPALVRTIETVIATCLEMPFSQAYVIAAAAGQAGHFTLVDTAAGEQLPLEAPAPDVLGWGLVDVGTGQLYQASLHRERKEKAGKALALLQQRGFAGLTCLRDLEHRDLERALGVLPRRLKPVVRHLVTENRRVQKLVVAARRRDWQMFGTLLLMSHASLRDDWKRTGAEVDFVVEQVEAMSLDGMYGACVTGRGGCVLVLGQPFAVPDGLDRVRDAFSARFGRTPEAVLL